MTIGTIIIFLVVLAVLIFVHEFGHFVAAKSFGIRVDAFKIGFGPKVFAWRMKGKDGKLSETEYGLNWIPFGGYVKIFGEDPNAENTSGPDAARSFVHKPRWQQAIVLAAGVLMNFIFAWILYIVVFSIGATAVPSDFPQYANRFSDERILITGVMPGSPAEKAGLKMGDVINEVKAPVGGSGADLVAGTPAFTTENIQGVIDSASNGSVTMLYTRGGQSESSDVTPLSGIVPGKLAIGIAMSDAATLRLPFFSAVKESVPYTYQMLKETVVGLYRFVASAFQGTFSLSQVSGPVGIAVDTGYALELGFSSLLMFVALISINLGVVNLIPFPALDGGRILFVGLEAIFRRRIPAAVANTLNVIGFALLMLLMVVVTWGDVAKLITK